MSYGHAQEFAGHPIIEFVPGNTLVNPAANGYRIGLHYGVEDTIASRLATFLSDPLADRLETLVLGTWFTDVSEESDAKQVVESLISAASQLPNLKALFLGDIMSEECEISWIQHTNITPLLKAYPRLETVLIRGGFGLSLDAIQHDSLKSLTVECGGLPKAMLHGLSQSTFPALESLQLYLGIADYGWDGSIDDVRVLLNSEFPNLTHLGLVDSEDQDAVTQAILSSPIMSQLKSLDLSLGVLTDEGGKVLLESEAVKGLESLTIVHHFLSDGVERSLGELPIKTEIDRGDAEVDEYDGEVFRYVAVGE